MSQMKLILIISLFSSIFSQQCVLGQNCPFNQGVCVGATCECLEGYKTFYNPQLAPEQQTYCNYKQIHHLIPLTLEFFFPGIGHFYVGKYWFGLIKLILALVSFCSSYYLYGEMKVPNYIEALKKTILNTILETLSRGGDGNKFYDVVQFCFNVTFHPFWVFWAFDLYMYFTKTYFDGNGMPFY